MQIDYRFGRLSAVRREAVCAIGLRYDQGYRHPDFQESHIVGLYDGLPPLVMQGTTDWYVDLWQSERGAVFVADLSGLVLRNDDPRADPDRWVRDPIDATLSGLWGLADDQVFTWNVTGGRVFRFDGASWRELPAVGADIKAMHGIASDLILAVGVGVVARWDGQRWLRIDAPDNDWNGVHVVSADEIYLVSQGGEIFEGSMYGVSEFAEHEYAVLEDVAKHGDTVYAASRDTGLLKLEDGELVPVDEEEETPCFDLDARGLLFTVGDEVIQVFRDGQREDTVTCSVFSERLYGSPPGWAPSSDMELVSDTGKYK